MSHKNAVIFALAIFLLISFASAQPFVINATSPLNGSTLSNFVTFKANASYGVMDTHNLSSYGYQYSYQFSGVKIYVKNNCTLLNVIGNPAMFDADPNARANHVNVFNASVNDSFFYRVAHENSTDLKADFDFPLEAGQEYYIVFSKRDNTDYLQTITLDTPVYPINGTNVDFIAGAYGDWLDFATYGDQYAVVTDYPNYLWSVENITTTTDKLVNSTLFTNASGSWSPVHTQYSSSESFSFTELLASGAYDWGMRYCSSLQCALTESNYSFSIPASGDRVTLQSPANASVFVGSPIHFIANTSIDNETFGYGGTYYTEYDWFSKGGVKITATRNSTLVKVGLSEFSNPDTGETVFIWWLNSTELASSPIDALTKEAYFNVSLEKGVSYWVFTMRPPYDYHQVMYSVSYPIVGRDFDYVTGAYGDYEGILDYPDYAFNLINITTNIPIVNASFLSNTSGSWAKTNTQFADNETFDLNYLAPIASGGYAWNSEFCTMASCEMADQNFSFTITQSNVQVTLINPANASNQTGAPVVFNAFGIGTGLENATLYGEFNGTWCANESFNTSSYSQFLLPLPVGNYTWNVEYCGSIGCSMALANYTFNVTGFSLINAEENSDGIVLWFVLAAIFLIFLGMIYGDPSNFLVRWFFYALSVVFLIYGFFVLVAFTQASPVDSVIFESMLDLFSTVMVVLPWFAMIGAGIVAYDLSVKWLKQHEKVMK